MGEVVWLIPLRQHRDTADEGRGPLTLSPVEQHALSDLKPDRYSQLLPLARLQHLDEQIRRGIEPAGIDAAEKAVTKMARALKAPSADVIADLPALREEMVEHLAAWPAGVLPLAVWKAIDELTWFPVPGELKALCKEELAAPRTPLRAITAQIEEHASRQREKAERQRREDEDARYCSELHARMAVDCSDEPDLADVQLAISHLPILRRCARLMSWRDFVAGEPQAAARLCQRLAAISRAASLDGKRPDQAAVNAALVDAGLDAQPNRQPRDGQQLSDRDEHDRPARPLGEVLAELAFFRLPDEGDPRLQNGAAGGSPLDAR
jgi:hypothetical protein